MIYFPPLYVLFLILEWLRFSDLEYITQMVVIYIIFLYIKQNKIFSLAKMNFFITPQRDLLFPLQQLY